MRNAISTTKIAFLAAVVLTGTAAPGRAPAGEQIPHSLVCTCTGAIQEKYAKNCAPQELRVTQNIVSTTSDENRDKKVHDKCKSELSKNGCSSQCTFTAVDLTTASLGGDDVTADPATSGNSSANSSAPPADRTEACGTKDGSPNEALNTINPNETVAIEGSDYRFTSNENGRVVLIDAVLSQDKLDKLKADERFCSRQKAVQRSVGHEGPLDPTLREEDPHDGGHFIGHQFGGPGERINLVPMTRPLNQYRAWKLMENDWAGYLADGYTITVQIIVEYSPEGYEDANVADEDAATFKPGRPTHFTVTWTRKLGSEEKSEKLELPNDGD